MPPSHIPSMDKGSHSRGSATPLKRVVVLSCTESSLSRVARPLREKGVSVRACADVAAARRLLDEAAVDLFVVERDRNDKLALPLLRELHREAAPIQTVLLTSTESDVLQAAINGTGVRQVIAADEDVHTTVEQLLKCLRDPPAVAQEITSLRTRCSLLEEKIDRLVRQDVQRDGAARLLHDLLVEIGNATGVKEIAGRCLARLITTLRMDMAFIVLSTTHADADQRFFSFGCPRDILDHLHALPWDDLISDDRTRDDHRDEQSHSLLQLAPDATGLSRAMRIKAIDDLSVIPLRAQTTTLGYLGFAYSVHSSHEIRQAAEIYGLAQLQSVTKQIAIAIDNARLVETAGQAQAMAAGALQHLPSTVMICDRAGGILQCYDRAQRLFGGRRVAGDSIGALLSPAQARVVLKQIGDASRARESVCLKALQLHMFGKDHMVNITFVPLPSGDIMTLWEDVTRRESIAGDLRRARALTSSLFANAPAGVLFLRQEGEVVDINTTACSILKCTRAGALGANLADLYPDLWQAIDAGGHSGPAEVTFPTADGELATVSLSATRLGRGKRPAGVLLQLQDLGELQALREQIRRRDNLALMGQMVSFIAHEIRNPLFGISSAAQVLAEEADSKESDRLSNAMLSEIDRLGNLLEDLLIFGSKRTIDPVEVDPVEVCGNITTMYEEPAAQRSLTLDVALLPPQTPVWFDPAKLRQVVLNLLSNALDAVPDGGRVEVKGQQDGDAYQITVTNSGTPIPKADHDRIFDLFYSSKARGSGLGLPICRKIVEDHGGQLSVSSDAALGTRFSVRVPSRAEPEEYS